MKKAISLFLAFNSILLFSCSSNSHNVEVKEGIRLISEQLDSFYNLSHCEYNYLYNYEGEECKYVCQLFFSINEGNGYTNLGYVCFSYVHYNHDAQIVPYREYELSSHWLYVKDYQGGSGKIVLW